MPVREAVLQTSACERIGGFGGRITVINTWMVAVGASTWREE